MGLLKKLAKVFSTSQQEDKYAYWVVVKCNRCGEIIRSRVDTRNDLSIVYGEEAGGATTYFCRKVLIGEQHCFQRVEVELRFDQARRLVDQQVTGGEFVEDA